MNKRRILIMGASGMLGHVLYTDLSDSGQYLVYGTVRNKEQLSSVFTPSQMDHLLDNVEAENRDSLHRAMAEVKPDVVINCMGLVKQVSHAQNPLSAIQINALLPHILADLCRSTDSRLIHISTDCVFYGDRLGGYSEEDQPDARDLYGRSKLLGEVMEPHVLTLRTSIIGHELFSQHSLLEWFLSNNDSVPGYRQAIFSGLPTIEFSRILQTYILPDDTLSGLYHLSTSPISKYDLLRLIAEIYQHTIPIIPDDGVQIDRTLHGGQFIDKTGYEPRIWPDLLRDMYNHYENNPSYCKGRQRHVTR